MSAENNNRFEKLRELLGKDACRALGVYPVPPDFLLSVVIPAYNEGKTIDRIIKRVQESPIRKELIIVNDGSTDNTRHVLEAYRGQENIRIFNLEQNQGKGAALQKGFLEARGNAVIVQDADLEYDPEEYLKLLQPIIEGEADVVYGSRLSGKKQRVLYFWHYVGNKFLTLLSNVFTNLNLTDMETGYKVFKREVIQVIAPTLQEKRFGIEPEITAKISKLPDIRIYEMPISYAGRTYKKGKKIGWKDGFRAIYSIVKYNVF